MINFNKYKNDGWGLSKKQLQELYDIINNIPKKQINVVEFGSGKSTEFLGDIDGLNDKVIHVTTFDDNIDYAYSGKHLNVDLKIRNLLECSDSNYDEMFKNLSYNKDFMKPKSTPLSSRQKNNFYDIQPGDLNGIYDLMVLDGPNGNGRNISFLHIKKHLTVGSHILIDDYTHYDFMDKLKLFFDFDVVFENNGGGINQWETGGIYKIVRLL